MTMNQSTVPPVTRGWTRERDPRVLAELAKERLPILLRTVQEGCGEGSGLDRAGSRGVASGPAKL
jgi:hypothetical protein